MRAGRAHVGGRRLEDVGLRDDEEDVLALLDGHAHDARHGLHTQLLHRLARLLLAARLLGLGGVIAPLGIFELWHVVVRVILLVLIVVLDLGVLLLLGLGRHGDSCEGEGAGKSSEWAAGVGQITGQESVPGEGAGPSGAGRGVWGGLGGLIVAGASTQGRCCSGRPRVRRRGCVAESVRWSCTVAVPRRPVID